MNERIVKLFMQSVDSNYIPLPIEDHIPSWTEKFAELIVRECAKVADQWVNDEDNGTNLVSKRLRQHFGVGPNVDENLRSRSTYFGNDI